MKLVRASEAEFVFRLGKREKGLLLQLLRLYPRVPPAHHKLSQASANAESERLLKEALDEQRVQNKKLVERLVENPAKFKHDGTGLLLALSPGEFEWLLQVLNDVRVGSWINLGSPETLLPAAIFDAETAPDVWAMEMCGYFQAGLLEALKSNPNP